MRKQVIVINIEEVFNEQLRYSDNYIQANNAIYLGKDRISILKYITLLPDWIKEINDVSGSFLYKFTNVSFDPNRIKNTFTVKNEIYNNIYEYITFLVKQEIDNATKHPIKIANISYSLGGLTESGYREYTDGIIPLHFGKIIRLISDFIGEDEWNIYEVHSKGYDIFITKDQDWRILEWERMTRPKAD